jgi:hypothetical protein
VQACNSLYSSAAFQHQHTSALLLILLCWEHPQQFFEVKEPKAPFASWQLFSGSRSWGEMNCLVDIEIV